MLQFYQNSKDPSILYFLLLLQTKLDHDSPERYHKIANDFKYRTGKATVEIGLNLIYYTPVLVYITRCERNKERNYVRAARTT